MGGRRRGRTKSATSPLFSEEKRHDISEQNQLQQSHVTRAGIKGSECTEIRGEKVKTFQFCWILKFSQKNSSLSEISMHETEPVNVILKSMLMEVKHLC